MNRTLRRKALFSKYRSTMAVMDSWLDNPTDTAPDFAIKGEAIVKELDPLVAQLDPLFGDALFQPLLDKSKDGLSKVRAHLYKASAATPKTDGAAAPVKSTLSHTTVLQLKPPTFTGKVRDFHGFQEHITDMYKNRPDITSDADKASLLREAMLDPTLKAQVEQYGRGPDGFNSAMEALRIRYRRATIVFPVYVKEMIQQDRYGYTQDSML